MEEDWTDFLSLVKVKRNHWFLLSTKSEIKQQTKTTSREIYKSFSFIHLIAVFGNFFFRLLFFSLSLSLHISFGFIDLKAPKSWFYLWYSDLVCVSGCDDNKFDQFIGVSVSCFFFSFFSLNQLVFVSVSLFHILNQNIQLWLRLHPIINNIQRYWHCGGHLLISI